MISISTQKVVSRLETIECLALIPRVGSTNALARRIAEECIENELPIPSAILVAGEQLAGRGRAARTWHSPPSKGIYLTVMHTRPEKDLSLVPFAIGNIVAGFLRETYEIDARLKWPNDIMVEGKKIAGVLIEARIREEGVALIVGVGINVEQLSKGAPPGSISIAEAARESGPRVDLTSATVAFIEYLDHRLSLPFVRQPVLEEWTSLTIHTQGDRISCSIGDRSIDGTWGGIDEQGRAVIHNGSGKTLVSAGDIMIAE